MKEVIQIRSPFFSCLIVRCVDGVNIKSGREYRQPDQAKRKSKPLGDCSAGHDRGREQAGCECRGPHENEEKSSEYRKQYQRKARAVESRWLGRQGRHGWNPKVRNDRKYYN